MSGLGSLGIGGSSSTSSNLSALAPPFTVDRSVAKTNSNPPTVNFNEPPYVASFNSAPHNWINPGPNYFPNHNSEVASMPPPSLPSPNAYPYLGSQSINSPSTQLPSLNPFVTMKPTKPDALYYGSNSNNNSQGAGGVSRKTPGPPEPKSYRSPYSSSGIHDDFLGVHGEPNFKLLGGSSIPHLKGSSLADGTKNLLGLEYTGQWGGYWNGLADGMRGKCVEVDDASCINDKGVAGSFVYDNYIKLGEHSGVGVVESSSIYYDELIESLKAKECAEKPLVDSYPSHIPLDMSKLSLHDPMALLPDVHPQDRSPESFTNFWSQQKAHVISSHGIGSKQVDSCVGDTSIKDFSTVGPYTIASGSSPPTAISYGKGITVDNHIANHNNGFGGIKSCNAEEVQEKQSFAGKEASSSTSQLSNHMKGLDILVESSAAVEGSELSMTQNMAKNSLDHLFKACPPLNISNVNCPSTFSSVPNETESKNVESTSEGFDHFNHAVDSPCWKGASTSSFFAFGVSEVDTSELCPKNEGNHNSPNVSSQSSNTMNCQLGCVENGCSPSPNGNSIADFCSGEQRKNDSSKAASFPPKLASDNKVQLFDHMHDRKIECTLKNEPKGESSKQSHNVQAEIKVGNLPSEIKFSSGSGVADTSAIASAGFEDNSLDLALNSTKNFSNAPSGEDLASKLISLLEGKPTPKVDAQMLVDVMLNLSVVLVSCCKHDGNTLNSEDCEVLQHVIDNLGTCLGKNFEQGTSTKEFVCQQNISCSPRVLPDLPKGATCGLSEVRNVAAAAEVPGQLDDDSTPEEKKRPRVSQNSEWNSLGFLSSGNQKKMDEMTQAIKKILDENFLGEEEKDPQSLLYKNLWLEAEAALCSINYKARYDRMKKEMEKSKTEKSEEDTVVDVGGSPSPKNSFSHNVVDKLELQAKDGLNLDSVIAGFQILKSQVNSIAMNWEDLSESEDPVDVAEPSSAKGSPPCKMVYNLELEAKDGLNSETCTKTSTFSTSDSRVDEVESSVMARFRILKSRLDNISPVNVELQTRETIDHGEKVTAWPFISDQWKDKILDVTTGSIFFNHHVAKNVEDHFTTHSDGFGGNTVRESQPAGDYDSPQSDWEHVLKDDLVWKQ